MGYMWVAEFCSQADFVVKTDDDLFVDLYEVNISFTLQCITFPNFDEASSKVYRLSKKYKSSSQYNNNRYNSTIITNKYYLIIHIQYIYKVPAGSCALQNAHRKAPWSQALCPLWWAASSRVLPRLHLWLTENQQPGHCQAHCRGCPGGPVLQDGGCLGQWLYCSISRHWAPG